MDYFYNFNFPIQISAMVNDHHWSIIIITQFNSMLVFFTLFSAAMVGWLLQTDTVELIIPAEEDIFISINIDNTTTTTINIIILIVFFFYFIIIIIIFIAFPFVNAFLRLFHSFLCGQIQVKPKMKMKMNKKKSGFLTYFSPCSVSFGLFFIHLIINDNFVYIM